MGWLRWLLKREWLVLIIGAVCFLRIPTLWEPYWYGDEGIYLTIGQELSKGENLYKDIHDNKPPLIYLTASLVEGKIFWYRFIAAGFNIGAVVFFGLLARKVFEKSKAAFVIATWGFALLTNIPFLEGNIANAENFFIFPLIWAAYILYQVKGVGSYKKIFFAGVLVGLAGLYKIPAIAEIGIWPLLWIATNEREKIKKIFWLGLGAGIPLIISLVYFYYSGVINEYLIAAGLQNVGYVSSWQSGVASFIDLKSRFLITVILLGLISGFAQKIGRKSAFILFWIVLSLFAATLSGRPYPHYLLQVVAGLFLSIGLVVEKNKLGLVGVLMIGLVYVGFSFWRYPVAGYYINFLSFITGNKDKYSYYQGFSSSVNYNYDISMEIRAVTSNRDPIFVWGDEPAIYAISNRGPVGKYTARYHIFDFRAQQQTIDLLRSEKPKVIVTFGEEDKLPGLGELLEENYLAAKQIGQATIYRRLSLLK